MCEEVIANDTEAMTGVRPRPGVGMKSVVKTQRPTNTPKFRAHICAREGGGEAQTPKVEAVASA